MTTTSNCKACEKQSNQTNTSSEILSFGKSGNMAGALGASFGLALDANTSKKVGMNLGGKSPSTLMKLIDTPGSNKQKSSMNDSQKKSHLINSMGLGNFSLNSSFEGGLINSISSGRENSSSFLKGDSIGSSLIGASSLGIGPKNGDMLGVGEGDSTMFQIFKLAAFGLKMLCASLKDKQRGGPGGYTSDTEEALGLLLSLSIDLSLIARLKSIFDKLLSLTQPNFSSFGTSDLNIATGLFNLCDWVENMEYGSNTVDTLRKNLPLGLSNKKLTALAGKQLIDSGTYDTYARNDFGFDQQFKSIAGDIDALKCDACNLGKGDLTIQNQGKSLFNVEFDPRTGLNREVNQQAPTSVEDAVIVQSGVDIKSDIGGISFDETNSDEKVVFAGNNSPKIADALTKKASAGDDKLHVNNPTQYPVGSWIEIGEGTETAECAICVDYSSLKLKTPLKNSHDSGTGISHPKTENPCEQKPQNVKSKIKVENTEFSQKSIKTQVRDATEQKTDKEIVKKDDTKKSVNEHMGMESEKDSSAEKVKEKSKSEDKTPRSHNITEGGKGGIEYDTDDDTIVYDTYIDDEQNVVEDTYKINNKTNEVTKVSKKIKTTKPFGGEPAKEGDTEVKSYFTGETITREELKGTILEDADLNAVGLLHPNDLANLKKSNEVNKTVADAEKKFDEVFDTEIEKTINLVLEQQSNGIIFGVQLPSVLNGNQIVINSERILISAKTQECGIFSKRKFFVTTDDEITMNSKRRFVVKTDIHASIEAPTVHLGTYTTKNHPSLKGDCVKWWLDDLCDWLSSHVHYDPYVTTSVPVQQGSLASLKARTPTLLSERIFISG
jgi:hypothetical protein